MRACVFWLCIQALGDDDEAGGNKGDYTQCFSVTGYLSGHFDKKKMKSTFFCFQCV